MVIGSFLHVVGERIPLHQSIVTPRSHCMGCKHPLKVFELIPVVSFCFLKGVCRRCVMHLPVLYPIIEIVTGVLFLMCWRKYAWSLEFIFIALLCSFLVVTVVSDLLYMRIPHRIFFFFFPLFVIYRFLSPLSVWWSGMAGVVLCFLSFICLDRLKPNSLGGADMKLFCVLAFCFGVEALPFLLFFSSACGIVYAKLFSYHKNEPFPFVPSISIAVCFYIFSYDFFIKVVNWLL
ncbi:prepilin peptidase [Bacillus sp. NPDC077027]|uniref:prepilin peptidase n=1 Tax=Bacillus sp. NPDC077027 TaxID=3390548 RepID=UPI003D014DEF